jgi:hypothetical protein
MKQRFFSVGLENMTFLLEMVSGYALSAGGYPPADADAPFSAKSWQIHYKKKSGNCYQWTCSILHSSLNGN